MKHLLEMSADRGAFICQSQSTNLWMKEPSYKNLLPCICLLKDLKQGLLFTHKSQSSSPLLTIEPDKKQSNVGKMKIVWMWFIIFAEYISMSSKSNTIKISYYSYTRFYVCYGGPKSI